MLGLKWNLIDYYYYVLFPLARFARLSLFLSCFCAHEFMWKLFLCVPSFYSLRIIIAWNIQIHEHLNRVRKEKNFSIFDTVVNWELVSFSSNLYPNYSFNYSFIVFSYSLWAHFALRCRLINQIYILRSNETFQWKNSKYKCIICELKAVIITVYFGTFSRRHTFIANWNVHKWTPNVSQMFKIRSNFHKYFGKSIVFLSLFIVYWAAAYKVHYDQNIIHIMHTRVPNNPDWRQRRKQGASFHHKNAEDGLIFFGPTIFLQQQEFSSLSSFW